MAPDILDRKRRSFVLWRPAGPRPALLIGQLDPRAADPYAGLRTIPLRRAGGFADLWEVAAADCGLEDGRVYWYWFQVADTDPWVPDGRTVCCADPTAWTVDRRFDPPQPSGVQPGSCPASVVLYRGGDLVPCDPGGQTVEVDGDDRGRCAPNNRLVIYELPVRWTREGQDGGHEEAVGTFRDVLAQVDPGVAAPGFPGIPAFARDRAYLLELGVNALELLPPADHVNRFGWGYGTANFFAASYWLGLPQGQDAPTASTDLAALVRTCHREGVRFITDVVMGFGREDSYRHANYLDFHVLPGSGDPEEDGRQGWGGDLFKFEYGVDTYDPVGGGQGHVHPARRLLLAHVAHWLDYYRIDGVRIDSIETVHSYDFLRDFTRYARSTWRDAGGADEGFLVVGEELSLPRTPIATGCVDALWNEQFKERVRWAIQGRNAAEDPDFETTVRRMVDCRLVVGREGVQVFTDGAQAVNYVTSHDVEGYRNERLYNLLSPTVADTERRIELAFACLLTAVGIPMILAGEEFADPQDVPVAQKEHDPVDYALLQDDWRGRLVERVARLVRLRTSAPGLAVNDTRFVHVDFADGRRVVVWQRGLDADAVVVVANFSDWGTADPGNPGSEYVVPGWPAAPPNLRWREVTRDRDVPDEWAGREPLYPWEAKVYALVARA